MADNFWDKVQERAYYKHLNKKSMDLPDDSTSDWDEALREQAIEEKIAEEAYLHYRNGCYDDNFNWDIARSEIHDRIAFIAFYNHLSNINKSPIENWIEAEKIFVSNF